MQYQYCFAWGSKAVKHVNEVTGKSEGINGDLVILDINFRLNSITSIVKYDKFSGIPYIKTNVKNKHTTTDIDLVKVFAKPLVKYVIFKNRYKSLHLDEVAVAHPTPTGINSVRPKLSVSAATSISATGIVRILLIPITHAEQMYLLSISMLIEL